MVEFGKRLKDACLQHGFSWAVHCIAYNSLKLLIESKNQPAGADTDDASSQHEKFRYALDREIEKAVLFVLQEQGTIAAELERLAERRALFIQTTSHLASNERILSVPSPSSSSRVKAVTTPPRSSTNNKSITSLDELRQIHEEYVTIAHNVMHFVKFIDLNVTAVRKILKKYDKKTKTKLSHNYLSAYANEYVDSHLDQLYHDGGLSSLVVSLKRAFDELHHVEMKLAALKETQKQQSGGSYQNNHRRMISLPAKSFARVDMMESVPERLASAANTTNREQITHDTEPILQMIRISRERLKQNTKYVDVIAAQALMFEDPDEEDDSITDAMNGGQSRAQRISSFLNLSSTFLYMANYYIVAPTCGDYAARVGSSESLAGIVIGMTPNAALIATVLYSWWSNYSYKSPLIFAATCSVLGNITYALALYYNSISLIMIGRFLNGFGSARSINRRFIADVFTRKERTAASAAFVSAAALGMSAGPALASLLSMMTFSPESTLWTKETAPGWIMLFLWVVFLIVFSLFFDEPDRKHHLSSRRTNATLELTSKNEENTHLLADEAQSSDHAPEKKAEKVQTVVVMMTMWIYFVLKLVLESLLSSCPTVTRYFFGWNASQSGAFLALLGLLMFPANMVVARLSHYYEDKELIRSFMVAILCGCFGIIAYVPSHYSVVQYAVFGICIFISTNALEGPNMSLLSKTIPKSWARGTFNSGFIATEFGTFARVIGDVMISLAAIKGVDGMLNAIFFQMFCLALISVLLVYIHYDRLVEDDEDDEKSN
eukprot:scaffold27955_cov146-Skeletonema_marinoi.AAC.2